MSNMNDFVIENGVLVKYTGTDSTVVVPDHVLRIHDWAFCECSSLAHITIPESVNSIGEYAFFRCSSLASVKILSSDISIHKDAFHCCSGVDFDVPNISILPAKLRVRAVLAFAKDGGVSSDPRSESHYKYIKSNAGKIIDTAASSHALLSLMCRERLISAKLAPEYIEAVQRNGDPEMKAMILDYQNSKLTGKQKEKASKQKEKQENAVFDRAAARMNQEGISGLNFVLTGSVDTFANRKDLKEFIEEKGGKLQSSISAKTDYLIMNTDSCDTEKKKKAEELCIDIITEQMFNEKAGRQFYINNDGVLIRYLGSGRDVVIPAGVTEIGHRAFWGCSDVNTVVIPDSVTEINSCAFWGCESLASVAIPKGVAKIHDHAFCFCKSLVSAVLPESITSIHKSAFDGCNNSFEIHSAAGSYAEVYAKKNNIPFVAE